MMKRILALVLACLLLGAAALAEVTGPLFQSDRMSDSDTDRSGTFTYTVDRLEGLVDLSGNVLMEPQFGDLSYAGEGYYEATNEGGFNTSALVTASGEAVTPFEYSDFDVLSPNWAIGVVLEGTNDKDASDYTVVFGEYDYAVIVRNDVFYLPEKKLVGTLERAQLSRASASATLENWLLVEDRAGVLTAYDTEMNAVTPLMSSSYDPELIVKSDNELSPKALYSAVTGEKLSDKAYESLSKLDGGYTSFYDRDSRLYGILNNRGEEICPPTFGIIYSTLLDGRYFRVANTDENNKSLSGLYDLETGALAIPCAYDNFYMYGSKHVINNGYICVEQDGKLGYIDTEGNVTCPIQYNRDSVDYFGCTLGATDMTGTVTIVSADGTITQLPDVTELATKNKLTQADGYYLVVKNAEGNYGIVDWHGNQIVDFVLDYSASVYDGDCLYTGSSIYKIER